MENYDSVDQQRHHKVQQFLTQYATLLARQGTVARTWRRRAGRKIGPYHLLVCRDAAGQQVSVYLGPESVLVDETRAALALLQNPLVEQRQLAQVHKHLRAGLAQAKQQLDQELKPLGMTRKGCEIRGGSRAKSASIDRSNPEMVNSAPEAGC